MQLFCGIDLHSNNSTAGDRPDRAFCAGRELLVLCARCPTDRISNGKSRGKGNAKNGNRYLAMAYVDAAHYATIREPAIKRYYQRKCKKKPVMVVKKTVANKLSRACYHMLKEGTAFDVTRAFG